MVPLGEGFFVIDLIKELDCPAIVVGRNKLGVLNHTLMTVAVLETVGVEGINVLMMGTRKPDLSSKTNPQLLEELLGSVPVFQIPYLAGERSSKARVKKSFRKLKKTLAQVLCFDTFSIRSLKVGAASDAWSVASCV